MRRSLARPPLPLPLAYVARALSLALSLSLALLGSSCPAPQATCNTDADCGGLFCVVVGFVDLLVYGYG
jgi:hypothetical protein